MKKQFAALVAFCNDDVLDFGIEELIINSSDRSKEILDFVLQNKIFRTNVMRSGAYRCVVIPEEMFNHLSPEFWKLQCGCAVEHFEITFGDDGYTPFRRILTNFGDLFDYQDTLSPVFKDDNFFSVFTKYGIVIDDLMVPNYPGKSVTHPNPDPMDPDSGLQFSISGRINSSGICNLFSMIAWSGIFFDNLEPNLYHYDEEGLKIPYDDIGYRDHNVFDRNCYKSLNKESWYEI